MARPSKKAISKAQEASKALDRIFAEVDPNLIVAGFLGGTAAAGGLTPPFTRLLMSVASVNGNGELVNRDLMTLNNVGQVFAFGPGGVIPGLFRLYMGMKEPDPYIPQENSEAYKASAALFASGALEAMLMYKAFSTPGLLEAVVKAPAEMIKGVGEIVPG